MKTLIFVAFAILLVGCPHNPVVHHPTDTASCGTACQHLRDLKCEEGSPLPDGTTCEGFCQSTQNSGHALVPSCVVNIKQCTDMNNLDAFCPKTN